MDLRQARQQLRDRVPNRSQRVRQPQGADLAARGRLDAACGTIGRRKQPPAIAKKHGSLWGAVDTARRAPQQRDPKRMLERLDLLADGLLSDVEVVCCVREASPLGHRDERAQVTKLKTGSGDHDSGLYPARTGERQRIVVI